MRDNERQAVKTLREPCVDCDGVFNSPRWQTDIADTIETLAAIADAAEEVYGWLKRNKMENTAHGQFLTAALQKRR